MKQVFKKSLIFLFTVSLLSSSCSYRKGNLNDNSELSKPEIINNFKNTEPEKISPKSAIIDSKTSNEPEVSARGKVLCFERAKQEKNEFLSKTVYENCLLTIDKNLEEFDEKQAELYFLEKKENKKLSKPKNEIKKAKRKRKRKRKKEK